MCIFKVETKTTPGAPAIAPRIDQDQGLPEARQTKDDDKVASIKYGAGKKESGSAAANKTGTDALKINIDDNPGAGSGGINV
tara:strand:- start:259 stop:504 length:246 start_codon:yes stop_codon:yes gene_type:complete